jgi:hypothetical protein
MIDGFVSFEGSGERTFSSQHSRAETTSAEVLNVHRYKEAGLPT